MDTTFTLSQTLFKTMKYTLCLALATTTATLQAEGTNKTHQWQGIVSSGITFGGDELATVETEGVFGSDDTEDIKAGELFFIAGGGLYQHKNIQLQATLGYHIDGVFAENGETSFTRWPLELLAFKKMGKFRLGGGLTHHLNPTFEFDLDDDTLPKEEVDFDNATGLVIEADYFFTNNFGLGLRHTSIEYKTTNSKVDGSHTGIILTYTF